MKTKPVIVQHCALPEKAGGPITGLQLLLNSPLKDRYEFHTVFQDKPAGGLNPGLILKMSRQIRKINPDLLHVRGLQNEGFHGILAGKLAGCKRIVLSVHGSALELEKLSRLKRFLYGYLIEPATLRLADSVYFVCDAQKKRLKETINFRGVIHNAAPKFAPTVCREEMRKILGIADSDTICIYVGRLTTDKGLLYMADAMVKLLSYSNSLKFIIVGGGPLEVELKKTFSGINYINNVFFLGQRNDIHNLLECSDIFIFPTLHENLSNALLEACVAGLGIVATDIGGNPEVIRDKIDGLLVPIANDEALTEKIAELIDNADLRRKLGISAKTRANEEFNQDKVWEQISALYDQLLEQK